MPLETILYDEASRHVLGSGRGNEVLTVSVTDDRDRDRGERDESGSPAGNQEVRHWLACDGTERTGTKAAFW